MSKRLRIGHADPSARRITCDTGLYTVVGSDGYRDIYADPDHGTLSVNGQQAVVGASNPLVWPTHSPSFVSVLPRHGGYGLDTPGGTGRHLAVPATSIILVDSLAATNTGSARPELGTNVYSGTFEYAWRHSASPKVIIPIISGWVNAAASIPMQTGTPPRPGYVSYWGQFAPNPGLFLRGTRPHLNGASNCVIMHLRSYMGDDPAGLGAENRDCFGSGYGGGTTSNIVIINSEFGFGVDETIDFYRPHTTTSWLYNVFTYPLHDSTIEHDGDPTNTDHGFTAMMGGDVGQAGSFTCFRNVFAHGTGRGPALTATASSIANNLFYNQGGRPGGGSGEAIDVWAQNTTQPMLTNVMGNGFIRGPEHGSTLIAVRTRTGAPAGTQGYLNNNAAHGWTAANQASFVNSGVGSWLQPTIRNALPGSWVSEQLGVLDWASSENPTDTEWHTYIDLLDSSCGAQPSLRGTTGVVYETFEQMRDRINGGSGSFQFVDTVAEAGGWWSVSETLIDPTNPGSAWHAPLPTGAGRDTPYESGTFSNGLSRVGRSPLEVWAIEEHWRRGGK